MSGWFANAERGYDGPERPLRFGNEAGRGRLRIFISLALAGLIVYGALVVIPVRAAAFQFDDAVREQVVLMGARRRRVTVEEIRRRLMQRAIELNLPITERQIEIRRERTFVRINVAYTVPVDFGLGLTYDWDFQTTHEGPSF